MRQDPPAQISKAWAIAIVGGLFSLSTKTWFGRQSREFSGGNTHEQHEALSRTKHFLDQVTDAAKSLGGNDRRWQMLALLFVAFALCYVDRQAVFSIFPVLKRDLGFSDTQLGLVGSLFGWSYALFMP